MTSSSSSSSSSYLPFSPINSYYIPFYPLPSTNSFSNFLKYSKGCRFGTKCRNIQRLCPYDHSKCLHCNAPHSTNYHVCDKCSTRGCLGWIYGSCFRDLGCKDGTRCNYINSTCRYNHQICFECKQSHPTNDHVKYAVPGILLDTTPLIPDLVSLISDYTTPIPYNCSICSQFMDESEKYHHFIFCMHNFQHSYISGDNTLVRGLGPEAAENDRIYVRGGNNGSTRDAWCIDITDFPVRTIISILIQFDKFWLEKLYSFPNLVKQIDQEPNLPEKLKTIIDSFGRKLGM